MTEQINTSVSQRGYEIFMYAHNETFVYDMRQRPVGSGAMGTVYRGRSLRDNRPVAIKMVNPAYAAIPSVRRRARQEANLAFRHQHLIEMLGCCETTDPRGPMFIVSNFINGIPLDKHVKENLANFPDRVERVCRTVIPVLDALEYLHEGNIFHLDIKPSNIMVENGRNVRLMDLGIANARGEAEITSAGLLGTPGYAAPEQYVTPGEAVRIDARTDIYELGVTLYELLAGKKPDPEKVENIQGVTPAIMRVIRKAIANQPDNRYSSARQMRQALEDALTKPAESTVPLWLIIAGIAAAVLILAAVVAIIVVAGLS